MLIRLVRMTFRPDALDDFLVHFDRVSPHIRAFEGCTYLELWHGHRFSNICTTHSHWTGPDALEAYRRSDLFRSTWAEVKPFFAAPPVASSHRLGRRVSPAETPPSGS